MLIVLTVDNIQDEADKAPDIAKVIKTTSLILPAFNAWMFAIFSNAMAIRGNVAANANTEIKLTLFINENATPIASTPAAIPNIEVNPSFINIFCLVPVVLFNVSSLLLDLILSLLFLDKLINISWFFNIFLLSVIICFTPLSIDCNCLVKLPDIRASAIFVLLLLFLLFNISAISSKALDKLFKASSSFLSIITIY